MGKYKDGINGPFRGKVGKVVGSRTKGVDYMRSLPEISTDQPSEKQVKHRRIFAFISTWLKPLKAIINIGFQILGEGKTPMNLAHSLNSQVALINLDGEHHLDYKNVILSRGELLISIITGVVSLVNAIMQLQWKNANVNAFNKPDDQATFVFYNPGKNKFATFIAEAKREDEEVKLQLPASFIGDKVHCWMHYVNVQGDQVSSSAYVGEMLVV